MTPHTGPRSSRTLLRGLIYAFPAVTFALGTWQVHRLQAKRDLKARLVDGLKSDVTLRLGDVVRENGPTGSLKKDVELRKVCIEGEVQDSLAVGPRVLHGQTGQRLVSLVKTTNEGLLVAVDRGWFRDPNTVVPKQTRFTGLLRQAERPTWYNRKPNVSSKDQYTTIMPSDFDSSAIPAFYVQEILLPDTYDQEQPRTDQLPQALRLQRPTPEAAMSLVYDRHAEYIATWYGLCAASLVLISKGAGGRRWVRGL